MSGARAKDVAVGAAKYALGLGLLGFVVYRNRDGLGELFRRSPDPTPLALMLAITAGCTAIQFYRWYLLVRAVGLPFGMRDATRLGLVGFFYNTFLPGSIGGDLLKAVFLARGRPGRRAAAVATVAADRLVGLFGLILYAAAVGGACWAAGDRRIGGSPDLQLIVKICLAAVAAAVAGWALIGLLPDRRAERFAGRLAGLPAGKAVAELWFTAWTYRQRPRTVLAVVALSAVVHTGFVVNFHLAVRVFRPADEGLLGTLPEHLVVAPIGYIAQAGFPAPGGVGGGEAIFGYLYTVIRGPEAEKVGVAGRLSLRLVEWALGLVGYLAYLRMRAELPAAAAEAAAEPEAEPAAL